MKALASIITDFCPSAGLSGFSSNAPGLPTTEGLASELILSAMLGAFFGLMASFLFLKVIRAIHTQVWARIPPGKLAMASSAAGALGFSAVAALT